MASRPLTEEELKNIQRLLKGMSKRDELADDFPGELRTMLAHSEDLLRHLVWLEATIESELHVSTRFLY